MGIAMATEFNDDDHFGLFFGGGALASSSSYKVRQSELTLAAMRAAGLLGNMVDGTSPPATDKFWLDKNTDPAVLKEWDSIGAVWAPVTFERIFERAAATPLTVTGGTANAPVVSAPAVFIPNRLYSLTPTLSNTGATTITVTGVGTFNVRYVDGSALEASEFYAGRQSIVIFRNGRFELLIGYRATAEAVEAATNIGVVGRSDFYSIASFQAAEIPDVAERPRVGLERDLANFIETTEPDTDPLAPDPDLPTNVFERHKRKTADGKWWEPKGIILTPEMFYHVLDGDNWAPAFQRMTNSAELWGSNTIMLRPGVTYELDDQFVIKPGQVWFCYGSKVRMRSNPIATPRGGFVRTQGSGTNVGATFIYRDDMIIYGMHAEIAPGVMGVNCFGTTVSERVSFIDCIASGAQWGLPSDPVKQGGRGFSCHPRSRNIKFINCVARNCAIGFHASDKADYDTVATPVLSGFTATPGNPTVFTLTNHGLTTGAKYSGWRFSGPGEWANFNNVVWTITAINANSFSIPVNSTGWVWNSVGRLAKADTGVMRSYDLLYENCTAENCDIAGIIFEQVLDSQDLETPRNFSFDGRLINCGTSYPDDQGVINISGLPGVKINAQVYNDSAHPVGAVLRGGGPVCDINVRGKVHTAVNMINSRSSGAGSVSLDGGSTEHPQGTTRATNLKFAMEFNTVTGDLVATNATQLSETDNQNYTWRNRYDIEYSAVSIGGAVVHADCKHATNDFRVKNIATGSILLIGGYSFESRTDGFIQTGTFTPTLAGSTTPGTNTYSVNTGNYTRQGKSWDCRGRLTVSGAVDAAMAGSMQIVGLPFTAASGQGEEASVIIEYIVNGAVTAGKIMTARMMPNTNVILLSERDNAGDTALTSPTKFASNFDIRFRVLGESA